MKTRRIPGEAPGEPRAAAAKQEPSVVTTLVDARLTRRRSFAWDPYEVWRTRVKTDQDPPDDAEATPAA